MALAREAIDSTRACASGSLHSAATDPYYCFFFYLDLVGIGDRHLGNFLVDTNSGDLIGIDFGYAFSVTAIVLRIPEFAPIRLTASLRELLEPSGPAGQFGVTLWRTLATLRNQPSLFLSTLQVCTFYTFLNPSV